LISNKANQHYFWVMSHWRQ